MTVSRRTSFQLLPRISTRKLFGSHVPTSSAAPSNDGNKAACQQQQPQQRKRVRFASESQTQYMEPSHELTSEICNDVWITYEELVENDMQRKSLARKFRNFKGKTQIEQEFESLYECCSTLNPDQVLESTAAKGLLNQVANKDGLRGLECKLAKTVTDRRKYHMFSMLSICSFESDIKDAILPEHVRQSIRASEILAQAIAMVDAQQALQ